MDYPEFRIYNVFDPGRIAGAISFRSFYDGKQNADRESLRQNIVEAIGLAGYSIAGAEQIHGRAIAVVTKGSSSSGVDGLATNQRGLVLSILVADCLPVYLWNARCDCVALIHAGWRGISKGIAANGIKCLTNNFGVEPGETEILLGPCICRNCYEVGPDVAWQFNAACIRKTGVDRYLLDIREVVKKQLIQVGVKADAIRSDISCTRCRPDLFYSYRQDGTKAGRMVATIALLRD